VVGKRGVVADELARRERLEDVQVQLVDGLASASARERGLPGAAVRGGILGARERAIRQEHLAANAFADAAAQGRDDEEDQTDSKRGDDPGEEAQIRDTAQTAEERGEARSDPIEERGDPRERGPCATGIPKDFVEPRVGGRRVDARSDRAVGGRDVRIEDGERRVRAVRSREHVRDRPVVNGHGLAVAL
jgi:hypothetical protein